MTTTQASYRFVFAAMLMVFIVAPTEVWSQVKKPGSDITPAPPKSKTKLEVVGVRENSGASMTIHSPDVLTFRWSTSEQNVFYIFWYVFDTPFNFGNTVVGVQKSPLAGEQIGTTSTNGFAGTFTINFEVFANHTPPESPKRYYVYVVTHTLDGKPAGLPSAPVIITYSRPPGWKPAELGADYCSVNVERPYHTNRCALRYVNFPIVDPILNRIDVPANHYLSVMVKSAAAGNKYQIDCAIDAKGPKPFAISGPGIFDDSQPQTGAIVHAIAIFESKNTDWATFKIKNEGAMVFFYCKVTNMK
ncbi:MAG TPA: hypothetical protein VGQ39_12485 [Pyrinomonadaceae bacterium]|jgi:hypothetical protein|nr:hypothetical protein [Pyrinomonadaceae bacterium]